MLPENRLKRNLEIKRAKRKDPLNQNVLEEGRHCNLPFYYPFFIEKHFSIAPPTFLFITLPNATMILRFQVYLAVGPKSVSVTLTLACSSVSLVLSDNQSHYCIGIRLWNIQHFCSGYIPDKSIICKWYKMFYIYSEENRILFVCFCKVKNKGHLLFLGRRS